MTINVSNLAKDVEKLVGKLKPGEKVKVSIIPTETPEGEDQVIPIVEQNALVPIETQMPAVAKPAIYFVDNVVYTPNGAVTHPSTIYNTMMGINDHMVDDLVQRTTPLTHDFDCITSHNIIENMINIVMNPFICELQNIYINFANSINDKWHNRVRYNEKIKNISNEEYQKIAESDASFAMPFIDSDDYIIRKRSQELKDAVWMVICPESESMETTEAIMNNTFSLYSISFINLVGMDIYNRIKMDIVNSMYLSYMKAPNAEDVLSEFIQDVDTEFADMMGKFTQASLAFCQNLDNVACGKYMMIEEQGKI